MLTSSGRLECIVPAHAKALREFLFTKEAAFELRKSPKTLARWRLKGTGPSWKYSLPGCNRSAVIYDTASVLEFARVTAEAPQAQPVQLELEFQT
jgi:hypothetical protein